MQMLLSTTTWKLVSFNPGFFNMIPTRTWLWKSLGSVTLILSIKDSIPAKRSFQFEDANWPTGPLPEMVGRSHISIKQRFNKRFNQQWCHTCIQPILIANKTTTERRNSQSRRSDNTYHNNDELSMVLNLDPSQLSLRHCRIDNTTYNKIQQVTLAKIIV